MSPSARNPISAARDVASLPAFRDEMRDRVERAEERVRSLELRVDQLERALSASERARDEMRLLDGPEQDLVVQKQMLTNLVESTPVALRELARRIDELAAGR